jgi:hypothetical protein
MKKRTVFIITLGIMIFLAFFGLPLPYERVNDFYSGNLEFFQIASAYARPCPNTICLGVTLCEYSAGYQCTLQQNPSSCTNTFC